MSKDSEDIEQQIADLVEEEKQDSKKEEASVEDTDKKSEAKDEDEDYWQYWHDLLTT